jgi:hypothetical protein
MKRHILTTGIRPKIKIKINVNNAIAICIGTGVIIADAGLSEIAVLGFQDIAGSSQDHKCGYGKNPFHNRGIR